jgi:hypothetical protein
VQSGCIHYKSSSSLMLHVLCVASGQYQLTTGMGPVLPTRMSQMFENVAGNGPLIGRRRHHAGTVCATTITTQKTLMKPQINAQSPRSCRRQRGAVWPLFLDGSDRVLPELRKRAGQAINEYLR